MAARLALAAVAGVAQLARLVPAENMAAAVVHRLLAERPALAVRAS
jgi:hypothetical protein